MKFRPTDWNHKTGKSLVPKELRKIWTPNGGKSLPMIRDRVSTLGISDGGFGDYVFRPRRTTLNVSWSTLSEVTFSNPGSAQDLLIKNAREDLAKSMGVPASYIFGEQ